MGSGAALMSDGSQKIGDQLSMAMAQQVASGNMNHVALSALAPLANGPGPGDVARSDGSQATSDQLSLEMAQQVASGNMNHVALSALAPLANGPNSQLFCRNKKGECIGFKQPRKAFMHRDAFGDWT